MKFDTTTIATSIGSVEVGTHPEEICINGNSLYAAIAGDSYVAYDSTLAVVDLAAFSLKEKITVALDPTNVLSVGENLYVIHYDTATWTQEIMEVNPTSKAVKKFDDGSKLATDGIKNLSMLIPRTLSDTSSVFLVSMVRIWLPKTS